MKEKIIFLLLGVCLLQQLFAQRLVIPGDHPDPSVTKIGGNYWASSTTSNWGPIYPLLVSKDLINWQLKGYVFNGLPAWADYYFWAPEISYDKGKVYVYYAAHKKGGNLCIGIASADRPEGPYKDHGPLMCQQVGSIDAFPMRDEVGKLYLIWKEDANSVGKPTPIWAMQLNEERTALIGEKKELFRNTAPWEANLVEGVSITKHGDYFYAFYAAAGCCGAACSYGTGIARSKNLLGPWEKYSKNPVVTSTAQWTCPGHGTPVDKDGHHYFLFHAYDRKSTVFTGREALLMEYRFTPDDWIEFVKEEHPRNVIPPQKQSDDFTGKTIGSSWQWSVFQQPKPSVKGGELFLPALNTASGAFLGQPVLSADYTVTVKIDAQKSTAAAGVAAIGDEKNLVSVFYQHGSVQLVQVKDGKETELARKQTGKHSVIFLQMKVRHNKDIQFLSSTTGKFYSLINETPVDGTYLPPWDRAVRAGVVAKGNEKTSGVFDNFEMVNQQIK